MVLRANSLEKRGIPYRTSQYISVRGRTLQKGESFSKRVYAAAVAQCERLQIEGIFCLLVESGEVLTLWREVQPSDLPCEPQALSSCLPNKSTFCNPPLRPDNWSTEKQNKTYRKPLSVRFFDWVSPLS